MYITIKMIWTLKHLCSSEMTARRSILSSHMMTPFQWSRRHRNFTVNRYDKTDVIFIDQVASAHFLSRNPPCNKILVSPSAVPTDSVECHTKNHCSVYLVTTAKWCSDPQSNSSLWQTKLCKWPFQNYFTSASRIAEQGNWKYFEL